MLNSAPFYFSSIRNLTASFGSLFNNINIVRYNTDGSVEKNIKVPLSYASADKTITMLQQQDIQRRENNTNSWKECLYPTISSFFQCKYSCKFNK